MASFLDALLHVAMSCHSPTQRLFGTFAIFSLAKLY